MKQITDNPDELGFAWITLDFPECTTRQRSSNRRGALTAWRPEPQSLRGSAPSLSGEVLGAVQVRGENRRECTSRERIFQRGAPTAWNALRHGVIPIVAERSPHRGWSLNPGLQPLTAWRPEPQSLRGSA